MRSSLLSFLPLALALTVACDKTPAPTEAPANRLLSPAVAPTSAPAPMAMPKAPGETSALTGTVQEKLDAAGYSYLRLTTAAGDVWAAVPVADVAVGSQVTVAAQMTMANFESKTLNRTFASVVFGTLGAPGAAAAAPAMPAMPGMPAGTMPGMAATPASAAPASVKVDKATGPNARTVAEVWAQKATIKGAQVTVHGTVVKVNGGIMGRNWLHIQDGSGTAGKDDDLALTSKDMAAVGDVVTVSGAVSTDKDFGAGYSYPVIIEDAKVAK